MSAAPSRSCRSRILHRGMLDERSAPLLWLGVSPEQQGGRSHAWLQPDQVSTRFTVTRTGPGRQAALRGLPQVLDDPCLSLPPNCRHLASAGVSDGRELRGSLRLATTSRSGARSHNREVIPADTTLHFWLNSHGKSGARRPGVALRSDKRSTRPLKSVDANCGVMHALSNSVIARQGRSPPGGAGSEGLERQRRFPGPNAICAEGWERHVASPWLHAAMK
jgi:hypothetical protein